METGGHSGRPGSVGGSGGAAAASAVRKYQAAKDKLSAAQERESEIEQLAQSICKEIASLERRERAYFRKTPSFSAFEKSPFAQDIQRLRAQSQSILSQLDDARRVTAEAWDNLPPLP